MRHAWWIALGIATAAQAYSERELAEMTAAALPEELVENGGFEEGTAGWAPSTGFAGELGQAGERGSGLVRTEPRSDDWALRLDARDAEQEVGIVSAAMPVTGGATYLLSAYFRHLGGSGFKVTLDWRDAGGKHIQYANDWAGSGEPKTYTFHGGPFTAPAEAAQVALLIGVAKGAAYVFDDFSLRRLGPWLRIGAFGPTRAVCPPGEPVLVRARITNRGGDIARGVGLELALPAGASADDAARRLEDVPPGAEVDVEWLVSGLPEGATELGVTLSAEGSRPARRFSFAVVADVPDILPGQDDVSLGLFPFVRGGPLAVCVTPSGVASVLVNEGDTWRSFAVLRSLAELVVRRGDGRREAHLLTGTASEADGGLVFAAEVIDGDGVHWTCRTSLRPRDGGIDYAMSVTTDEPGQLLALCGPMLFVGDGSFGTEKRGAVFPGLEFLDATEASSATTSVAAPFNRRYVPHPYKVTVPFMSLSRGDSALTLEWDPLQRWDGENWAPAALFASPNSYDGQQNHLMGLMVPTVPDWVPENSGEAEEPLAVEPGKPIRLESRLVALPAPEGTVSAVKRYFADHGIHPMPEAPRSVEEGLTFCAQALVNHWDADKAGWAFTNTGPVAFAAPIAAFLGRYAHAYPDRPAAAEAGRQAEAALAKAAGAAADPMLAFLSFDPIDAATASRSQAASLIAQQRPDGSWPFEPDEKRASLGPKGATELGICAEPCRSLLRIARVFGDRGALEAGLKGLAYIDEHFTRPAGGETWEVPLYAPNLRAAALAIEAYADAYRVTGAAQHLERARYWAYSGLPFIYQWQAPDRPIMPYASISVFGATFHTGLWFGNAVQWVGLAYAQALQELADLDRSFPWGEVARGITISAMQQQKTSTDRGATVGYYPDSYSPVKGDETYLWDLDPHLIAENLLHLAGMPLALKTAVVAPGTPTPMFISSLARISNAELDGRELSFTIGPAPEPSKTVLVSFTSKPEAVEADGAALAPLEEHAQGSGWLWDPISLRLLIRLAGPGEPHVRVRGVDTLFDPGPALAGLANGDFGGGLRGWVADPAERVRIVDSPGRAGRAASLDAVGSATEVQLTSLPFQVQPGREYSVSAQVMQAAGDGGYKVTVDWRRADGSHIRFDNDWAGNDRPATFAKHEAQLQSPKDATLAVIILGVRAGTRCLFDDVELGG